MDKCLDKCFAGVNGDAPLWGSLTAWIPIFPFGGYFLSSGRVNGADACERQTTVIRILQVEVAANPRHSSTCAIGTHLMLARKKGTDTARHG